MAKFSSKKPHFEHLHKKWVARHQEVTQNLFDKHLKQVALTSLGGLMLLSTPNLYLPAHATTANSIGDQVSVKKASSQNALLATELIDKLPTEMRVLSDQENTVVTHLIEKDLGLKVYSQLENKQLNRTFGVIGAEQHLYRYPGDTLEAHAKDAQDWAMYGKSGIAPGLGAWGYFAPSKAAFTPQDEERERYYLAVQTFLSPGYSERTTEYRDFYKFRKMVVINPDTGQAVVAVIGDAGPAEWTGKHLGGSPEVMHELGLGKGPRKGAVLYYFLDDPDDTIPLGPIKQSQEES